LETAEERAAKKNLLPENLVVSRLVVERAGNKNWRRSYRAHGRICALTDEPCHIYMLLEEKDKNRYRSYSFKELGLEKESPPERIGDTIRTRTKVVDQPGMEFMKPFVRGLSVPEPWKQGWTKGHIYGAYGTGAGAAGSSISGMALAPAVGLVQYLIPGLLALASCMLVLIGLKKFAGSRTLRRNDMSL